MCSARSTTRVLAMRQLHRAQRRRSCPGLTAGRGCTPGPDRCQCLRRRGRREVLLDGTDSRAPPYKWGWTTAVGQRRCEDGHGTRSGGSRQAKRAVMIISGSRSSRSYTAAAVSLRDRLSRSGLPEALLDPLRSSCGGTSNASWRTRPSRCVRMPRYLLWSLCNARLRCDSSTSGYVCAHFSSTTSGEPVSASDRSRSRSRPGSVAVHRPVGFCLHLLGEPAEVLHGDVYPDDCRDCRGLPDFLRHARDVLQRPLRALATCLRSYGGPYWLQRLCAPRRQA